jgi:high-affinity iron transporter
MKAKNIFFYLFLAGVLCLSLIFGGKASADLDYKGMAQEIERLLNDASSLYKQGKKEDAKAMVQAAYFEIFENLEGPIRINISAKKNFELEEEFVEIRNMIKDGKPADDIDKRIKAFVPELHAAVAQLEGGVELKAESSGSKTDDKAKGAGDKNWAQVKTDLFAEMQKAVGLYQKGDGKEASRIVQDAYFDIFEGSGMEARLGALDAEFMARIERLFSKVVGQIKSGEPVAKINETLKEMSSEFEKAVGMLSKKADSPAALFFYSLMIILREGFEAILIITAIIAYLVKTNHGDKLRAIYGGCISALLLSVVTAVLVKWVFKASAASQEALEGATMLLAALVLFSVSYWLISKAEAQKWTAYIKDKVSDSLSTGSVRALWLAAFLAVYREGAETVLFYQALGAGASAAGVMAISGGFIAGCAILSGVYLAMRYGAVKLPIRPFFIFTGALLYYMAFVFAGNGMMELIEGKILEPSLISWMPTVPFLGIYPYWQTLTPQMLLIAAAFAGLAITIKKKDTKTN